MMGGRSCSQSRECFHKAIRPGGILSMPFNNMVLSQQRCLQGKKRTLSMFRVSLNTCFSQERLRCLRGSKITYVYH